MLFQLRESVYLQPGKVVARPGQPLAIMDRERRVYGPELVAFAIPDDESQGQRLRAGGFETRAQALGGPPRP